MQEFFFNKHFKHEQYKIKRKDCDKVCTKEWNWIAKKWMMKYYIQIENKIDGWMRRALHNAAKMHADARSTDLILKRFAQ